MIWVRAVRLKLAFIAVCPETISLLLTVKIHFYSEKIIKSPHSNNFNHDSLSTTILG